ncbi:MAG: radical SAM protein [Candidatus Omnitrophica bacterium]|nr:radical SAM protein [Candidatus Omnitrophota bacterium]MDD5652587.1 radical SAM protein [Candidatus Omnitrophota bacterium]
MGPSFKKKIILFYAGITESGFNNASGNEGSWMNHGLCSISATLKSAGYPVSLIDLRRLKGWEHLESVLTEQDFDIAGLTMMSVDFNPVNKCIETIKRIRPRVKVLVGGAHASIAPEELAANNNIDHVFVGEAEVSLLDFLRKEEAGEQNPRLIYGEKPDLDRLPFVDRGLFALPEEPFVPFLLRPFVTIIAGRGCTYNCNYCQPAERIIFGKNVRRRSVDNVIEELKALRSKFRFNSFMIHDDCLTEDRKWVLEFCDKYQGNGFRQPFVCQSRADLIVKNKDAFRRLRDCGLILCLIGFESGSPRILKFLKKGCSLEQNLEAAEICHKLNVKIWANYMLGVPTETKEEQEETVTMIKKIRPYHCSPAYYTPHPGSDLFQYCIENNLSLIDSHDRYRRSSYEPKIRGIDYEHLKKLLYESISVAEDQNLSLQEVISSPAAYLSNYPGKFFAKFRSLFRKPYNQE